MNQNTSHDEQHYVDLACSPPENILVDIGKLYIMFGRVEYMVLIAIKRMSNLTLEEAEERYKGYTLGAKLHGKKACSDVGEQCRNFESEPGLFELAKNNPRVREICKRIEKLIAHRNAYVHGLLTTATPVSQYPTTKLSHAGKYWEVDANQLYALKDSISDIISDLNDALPVPGVHTSLVSGHAEIDVSYTRSALEELGIRLKRDDGADEDPAQDIPR